MAVYLRTIWRNAPGTPTKKVGLATDTKGRDTEQSIVESKLGRKHRTNGKHKKIRDKEDGGVLGNHLTKRSR